MSWPDGITRSTRRSRSSASWSSSSRPRPRSRWCSRGSRRRRSSGRRWGRRIARPRLPGRSAATWPSRCRTTSCTARTRSSRPSARSRSGSPTASLPELAQDAARNREAWDRASDSYQGQHREHIGRPEPRWGMWQLPEDELQILGNVAEKDVLELGCGAAQWSILLAGRGARVVALDNSARQLEHARAAMAAAGLDFPLVHSGAESVPLPDGSFDVVFADHGANRFADPYLWVPEAARLLRSGGLLAFSGSTP